VQWDQYLAFLDRKKKQIEEEIQHKKLRGITPEQMQEIDKQFKVYDANNNKKLETGEFKACLFSLGHDVDKLTVVKIMNKYGGNDKAIEYNGFKEFMIAQYGDTDTKEEILGGFKLINKGADVAKPDLMNIVMPDDVVQYVVTNAPKKPAGADYGALTEAMFAR